MVDLKISIPDDFLKEEVRCGYTVSKKMKEVWAVQLDLFAEFDRVCKKYNITYIASGGTMLGAVRHHGYIPWDDDMDLMMMRDQYEKLCKVAPQEFKHPYFYQTEKTDPGFHRWFARLRNSETTAIQKREKPYHPTYNQGIFIDIFPMDNVIEDECLFQKQIKDAKKYTNLYSYLHSIESNFRSDEDSLEKKFGKQLLHKLFGKMIQKRQLTSSIYKKTDGIYQRYNHIETDLISLLSFQIDNLGHAIHRKDMGNIINQEFEFLKIPIIANYDEHLKRKYGDYMTPMKNPNYHGDTIFDTSIPYSSL